MTKVYKDKNECKANSWHQILDCLYFIGDGTTQECLNYNKDKGICCIDRR